jgi:predicted membrane chloride channel (bestrophin family)
MQTLKSIRTIINIQTIVVASLAVISTWICGVRGWRANFPLTLIATAIVFPIVFSIGGAYKRREATLDKYGSLKAHGRAIYFAVRDWIENPNPAAETEVKEILHDLLAACRALFRAPVGQQSGREEEVYVAFSRLSRFIKQLRGMGLASGEASRCNQFLSKMVIAFESMKHVYQYRTPRTLRTYSKVFIYVLPVLYGPYFTYVAKDYTGGLLYVMPVLFSVILVSLDNIQDHLENPFDQLGEDDVAINAEKFVERLALDSSDPVVWPCTKSAGG